MRKLSWGFACLFLLQLGASASQGAVDLKQSSADSKGSSTKKSLSAAATPQALGDEIVRFFGRKTGKELMMEKSKNGSGTGTAAKPAVAKKTPVQPATPASVKPGYVPPPPVAHVAVPQIRLEIQKILELNKKVKSVQNGGSAQLQRVQEQARIHQKILDQLEASQKQTNGKKASSKSALLAQEKLRIIHEETLRNTQVIEDLGAAPAKSTPKVTSKVTAKVAPKETPNETPKVKISAS